MTPTPREWSRLPGEGDVEFATFQEWLHSTDTAGYGEREHLYEWCRAKMDRDPVKYAGSLGWAVNDYWILRAAAYDEWVGKRQVVKSFPLFSPVALLMRKIIKTELERISSMQDKAGELPGSIDARMIRGWSTEIRKMEEFVLKAEKAFAAAVASGDSTFDFTKLEIDELRMLEKLHEKAKVGA